MKRLTIFKIVLIIFGISFTIFTCSKSNKYNPEFTTHARYDIDSLYVDTSLIKRNDSLVKLRLNIPNGNPIKQTIIINSKYGYRIHPITKVRKFHNGIDIKSNKLWPIYTTGAGIVDNILFDPNGYGNFIVVNHLNGYRTLYAHLIPTFTTHKGKYLQKGELIGYTGKTGKATNYHLHYTIFLNNKTINPEELIYKKLNN